MKIYGIAPGVWENEPCRLVSKYANQAASALEVECEINTNEVYNTIEYMGESYGVPTREGNEMLKLMARTEGIFLDPVYTGKAMAAVYDHLGKGEISSDDVVVFLHTGGTPALFAYADDLGLEELNNYLKEMKLSEKEVKSQIKQGLAIQRFIDTQIVQKVMVSDKEVRAYYDSRPSDFKQPAQVNASHILIKVDTNAEESKKKEARKKIEKIQKKVKKKLIEFQS